MGAGDLGIHPARVVFEGRTRTAEVILINKADAPATYRVSFVHMAMAEDGSFRERAPEDRGENEIFADDLLRYSPREVTLEAKSNQVVRFQVKKPAELPDGEYRAHLYLRAVPTEDAPSEPRKDGTRGTRFVLRPIYGLAIPMIVRHGVVKVSSGVSDLALVEAKTAPGGTALAFKLLREGNASSYGDLKVAFTPAGSSVSMPLGELNGVAVYPPNPHRVVRIPLEALPPGLVLAGGRLTLSFRDRESNAILASRDLEIAAKP
ncbi:MAG: hypothetical protein IPL96_15725 [Holophagaceae bacterium]|nr:hypothetical protein [Holophagaceae bacterium]